ncbi:hypothetical protein [Maribacter sp. 2304DJ31-5]|uniref:hypothetical protein n=1 Tax=Maribacter sp. 2304DJ31-5 TaxID=3386273 RepID=UPI0039BC49D9
MGKKKLDELFREKFSGFQETPDERIWHSIAASLDKKKKKRIIPLWWQWGGIAAVLAIGLLLFNPFAQNNTPSEETITDVNPKEEILEKARPEASKKIPLDENTHETATEITSAGKKERLLEENKGGVVTVQNNHVKEHSDNLGRSDQETVPFKEKYDQEDAVTQKTGKELQNSIGDEEKKELGFQKSILTKDAVTVTEPHLDTTKGNTVADSDTSGAIDESKIDNPQDFPVNKVLEEAVADVKPEGKREKDISGITVVAEGSEKKDIFEEIEKEEETIAEKSNKKWSAGPSIAPVYYNAIGQGSPINSSFVSNSKSGDTNLSYGLSVAYELTNRLTVRSGIHKVDYGYDTNDVVFSSSLSASTNTQIDRINYSTTSENLVVFSNTQEASFDKLANSLIDVTARNPTREGFMSQRFGYLEVPVELNYALIAKKFGVNIIGGISSLFLIDNSIALTSGNLTTEVGEANNINNVNFSTNIGLGVNYRLLQNVQINVEPMFKYQLNTFSETDGTFRPYSIGIYSGLRFKF